jgi:hypothetical protein
MTRSIRALSCKGIDPSLPAVIMRVESARRHSNSLHVDEPPTQKFPLRVKQRRTKDAAGMSAAAMA